MKIVEHWKDDLGYCPSQCYLKIEFMGRRFIIYLRWRWEDPWQAYLCECGPEWDIHDAGYDWKILPVEPLTHDELDEIKESAISEAQELLKTI